MEVSLKLVWFTVAVIALLLAGCRTPPTTPESPTPPLAQTTPPTPAPSPSPAIDELVYVRPEEVGWSSEKLKQVSRFADAIGSSAVMAVYDGEVFYTHGNIVRNFGVHSIRKPFLGALYGIHVDQGNIDLDATLEELNIDDNAPRLTPDEKQATVRDLLKSRSGVYHEAAGEAPIMRDMRPERGSHPPDTYYYYNNWDFNALGTIFEQETGSKIFQEFKDEIADPIGMEDFSLSNGQYGYEYERSNHPVYAIRMSTRDMARFGQLYLQNGMWGEQQIVPSDWIEESTTSYSEVDFASGMGYGYLWNVVPEGSDLAAGFGSPFYFHTGIGVHALIVIPDQKLVIVHRMNTDEEWIDPGEGLGTLISLIVDSRVAGEDEAVQTSQPLEESIQLFEGQIESFRKTLQIPGMSVAVIKDQEIILAEGFGFADLENQIPAGENTLYHIASLTKTFAAALIMQLVEESQLNLDDEIADILKDVQIPFPSGTLDGYTGLCQSIIELSEDIAGAYAEYRFLFEDYRCDSEQITVRHHLTHTSQGKPGDAFFYNGFLFGWLSMVLEEAAGVAFDELLVDRIITPLGMTSTVPNENNQRGLELLEQRAVPYHLDEDGNPMVSAYPEGLNAGSGIVSTVLDLAEFSMAMDMDLIVSEESKDAMYTPTVSGSGQNLPYGLGWFVQEYNGQQIVWHHGHEPDSYSSLIVKLPEEDIALILLANSAAASESFNLSGEGGLDSPFARAFISLFANGED